MKLKEYRKLLKKAWHLAKTSHERITLSSYYDAPGEHREIGARMCLEVIEHGKIITFPKIVVTHTYIDLTKKKKD